MKRFFTTTIFSISILSLLFGLSGCDLIDDVISECDEKQNQMTREQRTFAIGAHVKYKDGVPAPGYIVVFQYKHEYCSGKINGENEICPSKVSDANGYVFSSYLQTYDYTNKKDRVYVDIVAYNGSCAKGKVSKVFRWEDVDEDFDEHVAGQVIKNFDVTLNWTLAEMLIGENNVCLD